jgi:hypothetical protein
MNLDFAGYFLRVLTMTTLFCLLLLAAEGSWTQVETLPAETKIQVVKRDKKSLQGEFVRADAKEIVVNSGGLAITVPQTEVVRVSRSAGRARNALIGTAIGVGAGAVLGAMLRTRLNNETGNGDQALGVALAAGAGAGAGIGASMIRFETIYRAH